MPAPGHAVALEEQFDQCRGRGRGMTGQVTTADEVAGAPPQTVVPSLAIETRGLRKEYGEKVAVHDVTIAVPEGEVFGFLGPNGAGKSTTVKMLLGLAFPTSGDARLLGQPLEPMQHRVEHPVRPLHAPAGQLPHALEDRVAVAVRLGQDRQDERSRGRGDQVLVDLHACPRPAALTNSPGST